MGKTQQFLKSFFKGLLTLLFKEEETKKEEKANQVPCEKVEATEAPCEKVEATEVLPTTAETNEIPCAKVERREISFEKMEELCKDGERFHDSVAKDILDPKSQYFYVIEGEKRSIIQKTGEKEEILASVNRDQAKRKARERQPKKKSLLNL